jgi:methyl-accepting chemotaxis protein
MPLLHGREFSLRTRLVALVAALLGAVSLFLLWYFPARMEALARVGLERRATGMATLLANAVAPGVEFEDAKVVSELLVGLSSTPEAEYAEVRQGNGALLAAWNGEKARPAGKDIPEQTRVVVENDTLHVLQPIHTPGGARGLLAVGFALGELRREQRDNLAAVGAVAAAVFVVGLLLLFLIGTLLVRPIQRASEVALHIAAGDLAGAEAALGGAGEVARMAAEREAGKAGADEVRRLSGAFARMLQSLRASSSTMHDSARILTDAVSHLTGIAGEHRQSISRQATALQETQVTAEEIKQTSVVAAQRAETVMQVAERAEQVGREGEAAIAQSLEGLSVIRGRVEDIARKIAELGERTRQIGNITQSVKNLADQSNMLALNAAIEAVRSGEHGKGFGVVAREIRSLADQSIQSTQRVREILEDITAAMAATVSINGEGSRQVELGLAQVRASGHNLEELAAIVKDNASAVRQISAAVSQQNVGIAQIFSAVNDLSGMMHETVRGIDATQGAVQGLKDVSGRIADVAQHYRL